MSPKAGNSRTDPTPAIDPLCPAFSALEDTIGYRFGNREFLLQALTHPSCAAPPAGRSHQRLEFLGDAVLGFVIASELYRRFPQFLEGRLTELRSALVCEASLAQRARFVQLGRYIFMGKGQVLQGGAENPAILADSYEALLGAIYLDGGLPAARRVIVGQFLAGWEPQEVPLETRNQKSLLLELAQARGFRPRYDLIFEGGPEHRKVFAVRVSLGRRVIGQGWGFRKRDAEQMAAREALRTLGS